MHAAMDLVFYKDRQANYSKLLKLFRYGQWFIVPAANPHFAIFSLPFIFPSTVAPQPHIRLASDHGFQVSNVFAG